MNGAYQSGSEYDTSDSASSNSSSSSSDSSSANESRRKSIVNVWESDKFGEFISIRCAENNAKFYRSRFARGSVGRCVLFRSRWMTPNEFQNVSGRQSSKDWKRSIRTNGRCLKEYISEGVLTEHSKSCTCAICLGEDSQVLRQEGELALAAKRRRLSQAEGGEKSTRLVKTDNSSERRLSGSKVGKRKRGGAEKRVWSPSGEVAQEMSSNEEDEYKPKSKVETEDTGTIHPNSVIDISDFIPRRSRRSTHRKHKGHRTELGMFTNKPSNWDSEEVAEFLRQQGFSDYATPFLQCGIDGQSLFLLKEHHLFERFDMKLGPALCLLDTVSRLTHPPLSQ